MGGPVYALIVYGGDLIAGGDFIWADGVVCNRVVRWSSTVAACCFGDGTCQEMNWTACAESGGVYQGREVLCDSNRCSPVLCAGDLDRSSVVDYGDIDLFVEALGHVGGAGWKCACPWLNGDCDGDGDVTYADIDPFVGRIGATCP